MPVSNSVCGRYYLKILQINCRYTLTNIAQFFCLKYETPFAMLQQLIGALLRELLHQCNFCNIQIRGYTLEWLTHLLALCSQEEELYILQGMSISKGADQYVHGPECSMSLIISNVKLYGLSRHDREHQRLMIMEIRPCFTVGTMEGIRTK